MTACTQNTLVCEANLSNYLNGSLGLAKSFKFTEAIIRWITRVSRPDMRSVPLEGALFKGPFGVQVLLNPASADNNQEEPHSDQIEHDLLEWDPLWPAIAGDSATFDGLYDVPGSSGNATILDPLLDVMNDPQSLLPPSLGTDLDELIYQPTSLSLAPVLPSLEVSGNKKIPPQAAKLLRYFKVNVISLSFPLKNRRQCPWQALSIHHTTSHTRMSLFYSLLAASCLHKYARDQSADDLEISAKWFKETAKQHLELALNEEALGPKQAKYKEILIAVLSMVMLSIFNGENSSAQASLVDAEYLIRIRDLPKQHKSLKVRSLHHIYTFLRIMAESTCGCALQDICPDRPSTSLLAIEPSPEFLRSFRLADVIRVANEQELLHRDGPTVDARIAVELKRRASMLEQYILSWDQSPEFKSNDPTTIKDGPDTAIDQNLTATHFMMKAMHQALILFYYRRVAKISALILQDTVRNCLNFLNRYDKARVEESENVPSYTPDTAFLWPGFVAACEALDPELASDLLGPFFCSCGDCATEIQSPNFPLKQL
ncbi:fungal-specific transcription factor domain-containing protein [Aspergillus terricola var. indicus]